MPKGDQLSNGNKVALREEVKSLLGRVRVPAEHPLPGGARLKELDSLEKALGLRLPIALRDWLSFCNGPYVGPGGLFGIYGSDHPHDIRYVRRIHQAWEDKPWIPVGDDGCGNTYVMVGSLQSEQDAPVCFVDREVDDGALLYTVGSDLWHFLRFFLLVDLGEERWPFDREWMLKMDPAIATVTAAPLPWEVDKSLV